MSGADGPAIRLCGRFQVALGDRDAARGLPGRQGRLIVAYLAWHRHRPVTRDELIDLVWASSPPARPDDVFGSLLSKVRRALGPGVIEGRQELTLVVPHGARVDVEIAAEAIEDAQGALLAGDSRLAFDRAQTASDLTEGDFLAGFDDPWVEERRRDVGAFHLRALECIASAGATLGGAHLTAGERAARRAISASRLGELGYRQLMEILVARGDVAAALQTYEDLRVLLRDELGIAPSRATRDIHERLLAAGDQPAAQSVAPQAGHHREERKLVTVLAAELESGDRIDDPEDLQVVRVRVHERLGQEIERFGGTAHPRADAVAVGLFGAAVAHEDDPERAVRAAVRLRELGLASRVAVATGEMLVAPDEPANGIASGRPIDDAMRMQRAAPSGGVVADEWTVRATPPDSVVYGALDRGMWTVRAVSDRAARPLEHPSRARFVGREHELALLENLYERIVAYGRPSMAVVLGDAGLGKSRLVDEFVRHIGPPAPSVYRGRCLAYGEGTTYWALREVLWEAAAISLDDPAGSAAGKLRDRIVSAVGHADADRVTAALAIASGIALPDNPLERLPPGSVADELALAWPALLSGLAAAAPVIVVIEDLHWAGEALLDTLDRMVARSSGPLLLVVTARPELAERHTRWRARPAMSQIPLEPLSEPVSRGFVTELLPEAHDDVREQVLATAEGNPFFAEELARHISDHGGDPAAIPSTVRVLLAARIDELPEAEKRVIQDAAVVGRVFWATALEAVEPRDRLSDALRLLEDRGFIVTRPTSTLPSQTELAFQHAVTREVAYRSIPRARRCRAHAAVGRWLEELAADRRDEFIDLLAHHYEAASRPADVALAWPQQATEPERLREKAVAGLLDAGEAARRRLAVEQALRFAERANALVVTDHERLAVLELEARTHHAALRGDDALNAYVAGIELARTLGDPETVSRLRAQAILLCVRYAGTFGTTDWRPQAIELIDQQLAHDDGPDATFARGAALVGRAWGLQRWLDQPRQDRAAAKRDVARAVAIGEATDSPELLAAALEGLTWLVSEEGFCEIEGMAERLTRASVGSVDRVEAHESKVTAAICFGWAGRFEQAIDSAREAAVEAARLSQHRALHSAMAQAFVLVPTGRFADLGKRTTDVLELAREDASNARTCMAAVVGIAGRALWLYEARHFDAAAAALDFMQRVRPPPTLRAPRPKGSFYDYFIVELLRPLIGVEAIGALLEDLPPPGDDATSAILYLRAQIPTLALTGADERLRVAIVDARQLARSACAPALGWIADWAAATQTANDDPAASLERALAATTALHEFGEPYTAARLLSDILPLIETTARSQVAEATVQRLTHMGALASAASLRTAQEPRARRS